MAVLAYTENWDGRFKKLSFELVSFAHQLAEQLHTNTVALSIGEVDDSELRKLGSYGAGRILKVNDSRLNGLVNKAYSSVIAQAAAKEGADIVVFANNFTGKALAPRVAVRLKAGMASGVIALPESMEPFIVKKGVFTGKAIGKVIIRTPKKVLTLFQNAVEIRETPDQAVIESFVPELSDADFGARVTEVNKTTGKILLTDAEVVVSGGRGMKGKENWAPLEELSGLLGAATACSRPVSDEGWRPHSEHVGQTGKIIAPNVYIALGISGAIQHLGGVSSSKHILAVNTDKDAPIFEAADFGIIGDVQKVLPAMVAEIRKFKGIG